MSCTVVTQPSKIPNAHALTVVLIISSGSELVERSVRRKIAEVFERLRGIGSAREQLQQFR